MESFVVLSASGGDYIGDMQHLRDIEAIHPRWDITLDVNIQLTETTKDGAQYCYEGYKAFGSAKVCQAETLLVLADEFRQGNVPPSRDI